ncbi:MAG: DUF3006 domain-containing protein [Clostridia bacterium]|nr:DUF3006 domain-containing protein [Clostridia bacterium]
MDRRYIIDRIEGGIAAVLCGDELYNIPLSRLPEGIGEGSALMRDAEGGWQLCPSAEEERRQKMSEKLALLLAKK